MRYYVKQPAEIYTYSINYDGRIPVGTTLVSGILSAINKLTNVDAASTILATTVPVLDIPNELLYVISIGGVHNTDYKITARVVLSNGMVVEDDITMLVREL